MNGLVSPETGLILGAFRSRRGITGWLWMVDGAGERRRPVKGAGLLRGDHLRLESDAQRLRNTGAICGIGLGAVGDMPLLDV
jgi:hypothetical protein